jgi:uncharacterized protein with HEPN domain
MFKHNDIANLKNILWAIEKIENSVNEITTVAELVKQEEKYDSVIVKLMNIGESAFNLSEELKNKFENVDWRGMYKMRNIITHSYHNVDENIIWDIIKNELPENKIEIIRIIDAMEAGTTF